MSSCLLFMGSVRSLYCLQDKQQAIRTVWSPRSHTQVVEGSGTMVRLYLSSPHWQSLLRSLVSFTRTQGGAMQLTHQKSLVTLLCVQCWYIKKTSTPWKAGYYRYLGNTCLISQDVKPLKDSDSNVDGTGGSLLVGSSPGLSIQP